MAKSRPKQQRLPGTEDAKIESLHTAGMNYIYARDERMEHSKVEKEAKNKLSEEMKKSGKNRYLCQGLERKRVIQKETVIARLHKAKAPKED